MLKILKNNYGEMLKIDKYGMSLLSGNKIIKLSYEYDSEIENDFYNGQILISDYQ